MPALDPVSAGPILAIVGSLRARQEDSDPIIRAAIERHGPRAVISGGALGADTWAQLVAAREYGLPVIICQPAGREWRYYKARDLLIAQLCDRLIRICSQRSKTYGSGWTRDRAKELGKPVEEFTVP